MISLSPLPPLAAGAVFAKIIAALAFVAMPQSAAAEAPAAAVAPVNASAHGHVDVAGAAVHYQIYGDSRAGGTPLLVLHGAFMSADAMRPLIAPLAATRPVIAIDARGHGRSGGVDTPLNYDRMADDAAAVLGKLGVEKVDVLGYSMGGSTAIALAIRHPDRVGKQIILSATSRLDGWYPEVLAGIAAIKPEFFANTIIETEYERLSPAPEKFPILVENIKKLDATPFGWSDAAVRAIPGKTMVIIGDADGVTLDHAIALFKLRGGGDVAAATQGFLTEAPKARLAILPAASHIGIMAEAPAIAAMVVPFLDDKAPPPPVF
ncbi:alpha/beta fold hydrolase [Sphingopyxis sp. LK2115]|jgi:pimeloyl-ACP methyl ester carboxylesterase|uniref:alpha/beta fold hydrolase n=1 Tax=Sphingopyxis sp. LK2115 TaxID=2744558 RepID=UPI00166012BD|nr:alpha/beta hydrolase [Sphingopyxis sp. LK2115]